LKILQPRHFATSDSHCNSKKKTHTESGFQRDRREAMIFSVPCSNGARGNGQKHMEVPYKHEEESSCEDDRGLE